MALEAVVKIQVEGAPSGNERLREPNQVTPIGEAQPREAITPIEETQETASAFNIRSVAAGGSVVAASGLRVVEQNNQFRGDSNINTRINEGKTWLGRGAIVGGLLLTGNAPAAALTTAYLAFDLALENRQIIRERKEDLYVSRYYQRRLTQDVAGRSR